MWYASYEDCEGKDAANYTLLGEGILRDNGERLESGKHQLITCSSNGQRGTDQLQTLAISTYPAGGKSDSSKHILLIIAYSISTI